VKNLFLATFLFLTNFLHAQFSAYDSYDDNSNDWIVFKNDTGTTAVKNGKLDVTIKLDTDFIDAKGAKIDITKPFRAEINASFDSGSVHSSHGICWGAADDLNYHVFYVNAEGKFGFKTYLHGKWKSVIDPTSSPAINVKGTNWLRVNSIITADGTKKLTLCINEQIVKQIDFIVPFGNFYGIYSNGKEHVYFDDFFVYQRGDFQDEFEPSDLSLSLACKITQLRFTNVLGTWSCCVEKGCRVDEDSATTRFWFTDMRAGDYSVLVAPFEASADGDFFNAAQRDFVEYIKDTADPITPLRQEKPIQTSIGHESQVVQLGEIYTATEFSYNMYIRRYYVKHAFGKESGLMFQFIIPENSAYIPLLDQLVQQVVSTIEFK
jgi:hypothetical protein